MGMIEKESIVRFHRMRKNSTIRELLQETTLNPEDFIMPFFVCEDTSQEKEISSLPGVYNYSIESLKKAVHSARDVGIKAILLFGIPSKKSHNAAEAYSPKGIVQKAIKEIKQNFPDMYIIADCCLCEYTDHGHCGIVSNGSLDNDATLNILNKISGSYAEAGVDCIAPSGMMDGMVASIRHALNKKAYTQVSIMSYAAKFASAFYGPFRDAAGTDNFSGDRKHHQINPSQRSEALIETKQDINEGADFIIVKPATHYQDIIRDLSNTIKQPIVAYHVSGEYAMIKHAATAQILNERDAFEEHFISLKRSGARLIISYYAYDYLRK